MVLQKVRVLQNFSQISRVSRSRFLAVMCVSQSRFFFKGKEVSEEEVSRSRFVCLFLSTLTSSRHLILNLITQLSHFREIRLILNWLNSTKLTATSF